jgi:hypothetical protein
LISTRSFSNTKPLDIAPGGRLRHNAAGYLVAGRRGLISACIAFHLVALAVNSLPDLRQWPPIQPSRVPVLDGLAAYLQALAATMARIVAPLRPLTEPYITIGLEQKWDMFSNPLPTDQYVRVDQYVVSSGSPRVRVFEELAAPAQREDQPRFVHKFRDKAVLVVRDEFLAAARDAKLAGPPRDVRPLAKYFRDRFRRDYLNADEDVVRTEVWLGEAPIPPPGQRLSDGQLEKRLAVLQRYWDGPSERPTSTFVPPVGAAQQEGDIVWKLEYAERP